LDVGLASSTLRHAGGIWGHTPDGVEPLSAEGYLRVARHLDLDGVHFTELRHFESLSRGSLSTIAGLADDLGLYIELGCSYTSPDILRRALEAAEHLSCRAVSVAVGASRLADGDTWQRRLDAVATDIVEIVPVLEATEIRLGVRNNGDLTAAEVLRLVEGAGSALVGACVHTASSVFCLEDPNAGALLLAPRAHTVFVADMVVEKRSEGCGVSYVALGGGIVANDDLVSMIAKRDRGVRININTPLRTEVIPYLSEGWRDAFGEQAVERFHAWVAQAASRSTELAAEAEPPAEEDLLEVEMSRARASAAYARHAKWAGL